MNRVVIVIMLCLNIICLKAHSSIDEVLNQVEQNNLELKAYEELIASKKSALKVGNNLLDPMIEYDFMAGNPSNSGNQTDVVIAQSFDFPLVYIKRKQLLNKSVEQLEIERKKLKQTILLDARSIYISLVYYMKMDSVLSVRKQEMNALLKSYEQKLEQGETTILDLNKSRMVYHQVKSEYDLNEVSIKEQKERLVALNGGVQINLSKVSYPRFELLTLEVLKEELIKEDFDLQKIEGQMQVVNQRSNLIKMDNLPKFELGYRYQSIVGQTFTGVHVGVSVPLFENRNKLKSAKLESLYLDQVKKDHVVHYHAEVETLYSRCSILRSSLSEYERMITQMNSDSLLKMSLDKGEISLSEYYNELYHYNQFYSKYLMLELEYNLTISELMKNRLN